MSKRTTIVLAVLNAALLGFILLYEQGTLSTTDVARRSGQVLRRFVRDRVDHVELVRGDGAPIVFDREREEDDELGDSLGTWTLSAPIEAPADDDAVDSFLSALEWLDARRTLEGIAPDDRARMGLDEPRFVVRFRVMDEEVALRVGSEAPTGDGVYAAVEGEDRAYVVGTDFVESIDHDVDHFRDKDLFAGFFGAGATAITVSGGGPEIRLEKTGPRWHVRAPVVGFADDGLADRLVRAIRDLRATRFVSEAADELEARGLDAPWREVRVTEDEGDGARLRVGEACGEHEDERYAIAGDDGPVVCVLSSDVQALELRPETLRETALLPLGDDAIERIEAGDVTLRRGETSWEMVSGGDAQPADDAAIAAWLGSLRAATVRRFEALDAGDHGVGDATVTFHRSDDEAALALRLGDVDDEGAWVRRGDEAAHVLVDAEAAALLRPEPLRFRATALASAESGDARRVESTAGGVTERAVRGEGGAWRLEAPVEMEADRVVVRDVARRLATLTAERFVADAPAPEHGLAPPSRTVRVHFEPEEGEATDLAIQLGARTVEGTYARLTDGPVFLVSPELADALARPLASLDALTVPVEDLTALRIERDGEVTELQRDGTSWQLAGGGTPDADRTRALLDRLSTLRATRVLRYGAPDGSFGLTAPRLRVVATPRAGDPITLSIGADTDVDGQTLVPLHRAGLDVVYALTPDLLRSVVDYTP